MLLGVARSWFCCCSSASGVNSSPPGISSRHADAGWVAAAVAAEALSLWPSRYLQHRVLHLSGTHVTMPALSALSLANDAIANTVPGEPVVSSAYRYRYYRRHGATGASAGWTIFTILIAQAIGMSLILLLGVLVALAASTHARSTGVTVAGLVIVIGAGSDPGPPRPGPAAGRALPARRRAAGHRAPARAASAPDRGDAGADA